MTRPGTDNDACQVTMEEAEPPDHTQITINDIAYPAHVLGPGRRVAIWMQGCTLHCPGCMATHTWSAHGGQPSTVEAVVAAVASHLDDGVDGITVSGGEPTQQPRALVALLGLLRTLPDAATRDVLVYTGRSVGWARGDGAGYFAGADAVMAGPFDPDRAGFLPLRGSDNQELIVLTALGQDRYLTDPLPDRRRLQLQRMGNELTVIGIPTPGALAAVRAAAHRAGLDLRKLPWTP